MVVPDFLTSLNAALEGLVLVNVVMLLAALYVGRPVPPLYLSGIRYGEEPRGREWWQTVADNFGELERVKRQHARSTTDCEDLASHRASEHRVGALLARVANLAPQEQRKAIYVTAKHPQLSYLLYPARAICVRTGPHTYHAIVEHPDGTREDPSLVLGMRASRRRS